MKQFSLSELALVCAPVALIVVGGIVFNALRRSAPPLNPNATIILSVAPVPASSKPAGNVINFARTIKAHNSPKEGIAIVSEEHIVAVGHGHSQAIYTTSSPLPYTEWFISSSAAGAERRGNSSTISIVSIDGAWTGLPVWIEKLEWRGEIAASPLEMGSTSRFAPAIKVRQMAHIRGAAYIKKSLPIALGAHQLDPIQKLELGTITAEDKERGMDTDIRMAFKNSKSQIFRELVAFDGKTRRVLWDDQSDLDNPYGFLQRVHTGTNSPQKILSDWLVFKLRKVPLSWGQITFNFNIVYAPGLSPGTDWEGCDKSTFQKLKKQGWLAFSRQLVIRRATTTK